MKKLVFFVVLFLTISFQSKSQDSNMLSWGGELKRTGGMLAYTRLLGLADNHYYFMQTHSKKESLLFKYDLNHKLVAKKSINLKNGSKNIIIDRLIHTKNKVFGVAEQYNKESKEPKLFISEFKNGSFKQPKAYRTYLYGNITSNITAPFTLKHLHTQECNISSNGEYVIWRNVLKKDDGLDDNEPFTLFDADMNIIWSKRIENKFDFKKYQIQQTLINNKGEVFLFAKEEVKIKKDLYYHLFHLFRIVDDAIEKIEIDLKGKVATSAKMELIENGDNLFFITGTYSNENLDRKFAGRTNGIFSITGNSKTSTQIHEFDDKFLSNFLKQKYIEKRIGLGSGYDVKEIISFNDGSSLTAIIERSYTSSSTNSLNGETSLTTLYGSLILPTFSSNGKLTNLEYLKRFSNTTTCGIQRSDDKTYLFFTAIKDKEEAKALNGKMTWKYLDLITLDTDGKIEYRKTISHRKLNTLPFLLNVNSFDGKNLLVTRGVPNFSLFGILKLE